MLGKSSEEEENFVSRSPVLYSTTAIALAAFSIV